MIYIAALNQECAIEAGRKLNVPRDSWRYIYSLEAIYGRIRPVFFIDESFYARYRLPGCSINTANEILEYINYMCAYHGGKTIDL